MVLIREVLSGVAQAIGLGGSDLNDIRTAVTEACNNVVLHAYGGEEGPLEIEIRVAASAVEVVVRDRGVGFVHGDTVDEASGGIGLPVIRALVHRVHLGGAIDGGTEVRMEFLTPRTRVLEALSEDEFLLPTPLARAEPATTTTVTIAPTGLAHTVLPRLLSALAARAHFSTDRLSDVRMVADALVAQAPGSISGSHLAVAISVDQRKLELRVGPLGVGRARGLVEESHLDGLGCVIEKLTDHHRVSSTDACDVLTLRLSDRR